MALPATAIVLPPPFSGRQQSRFAGVTAATVSRRWRDVGQATEYAEYGYATQ